MTKSLTLIAALAGMTLFGGLAVAGEDNTDAAALAKALPAAKVSLEQGMKASEAKGKPISAKFEVEDGALQLSVYVASGNQFSEVIVDHTGGGLKKTEQIIEGSDLKAARAQSSAMAKAVKSLEQATTDAVKANSGYRATAIIPGLKNGHPVAEVTLMKGSSAKTIDEKLD